MQNQDTSSKAQCDVLSRQDLSQLATALSSTTTDEDIACTKSGNKSKVDELFQEFSAKIEKHVPYGDVAAQLYKKLLHVQTLIKNNSDDNELIKETCQKFNVLLPGDCFELRGKIYELVRRCALPNNCEEPMEVMAVASKRKR